MRSRLHTGTAQSARDARAATQREPAGTAAAGAAQRLHDTRRMVAQRSRLAAAFGAEVEAPVQRMAASTLTDLKQAGGTCGLYSLGMAMSGVDGSLRGRRAELLRRVLAAGNEVGTFVGEFMDADNLAAVGRKLGFSANVIDFGDAGDMKTKLAATGSAGVVMGYSVFDDAEYAKDFPDHFKTLTSFKYLFSHWSVIESLANDELTVRDPNSPGSTRVVDAAAFHQANADAASASGKFSFSEFTAKGLGGVGDLRATWEDEELSKRAGVTKAGSPLPAQAPEVDLKLKGKIVTVSGSMAAESSTTTTAPALTGGKPP